MKMPRAGALGNLPRIMKPKTAPRRNNNAVGSADYKSSKHRRAGDNVSSAPGGENAMTTGSNHVFQSLLQIRRGIKGSVKSDFEGIGQLNECASALNVDRAVSEKHAENHTGGANTPHVANLLAHRGKGSGIVMKARGMGAHHHVDWNSALTDGLLDERVRRCKAVHLKGGAKLDAVCAALLPSSACCNGFSAQFEYRQIAHRSLLRSNDPNGVSFGL
jgi:hypothetical protein